MVHLVVYADDFVVSGKSKEILEETVKPAIVEFLKERGLTLSDEKTVITSIDKGFDFLGHNIRKYSGKLLIKPSKKNVQTFLRKIREAIKTHRTTKTENLIRILNPKIMGWGNYFRHVVAKETFGYVDYHIFWATWAWAIRRHPNQSKQWIWDKYFLSPTKKGVLSTRLCVDGKSVTLTLAKASTIPIRRHIKIKAEANMFDDYARIKFR